MVKVSWYLEQFQQLGETDFLQKYNHPFFIYPEKSTAAGFSSYHTRMADRREGAYISSSGQKMREFLVLQPNPSLAGKETEKLIIGRSPERDFTIDHSTVSKRHAFLSRDKENQGWRLGDVGSTNGTFLNGQPVDVGTPVLLRDGQVVSFGDCDFLFFSPEGFVDLLKRLQQEGGG